MSATGYPDFNDLSSFTAEQQSQLRQFAVYLFGYLQEEHKDTGAHSAVSAESIALATPDDLTGNVRGDLIPTASAAQTLGRQTSPVLGGTIGEVRRWLALYTDNVYFGEQPQTLTGFMTPVWRLATSSNNLTARRVLGGSSPAFIVQDISGTALATFGGSANLGTAVSTDGTTIPSLSTSICYADTRLVTPNNGTITAANSMDVYKPGATASVTTGNVISLGADTRSGLLIVQESATFASALFVLQGTTHATLEASDPAALFSVTAGTGASTNIYWSAGNSRYELENNTGGSRTYRLLVIGV